MQTIKTKQTPRPDLWAKWLRQMRAAQNPQPIMHLGVFTGKLRK